MAWEFRGKPRVAILTPHTGNISTEWADRVYGPLKFVPSPHFDKLVFMARGVPWDVARNTLVKQALGDPKVTHLMWIDSDLVFETPPDPNEAIVQLMRCDVEIVSGLYRAKQKVGFNYAAWKKVDEGYAPIQSWTGNFITVDAVGLGMCLCKREVFERVQYPWFMWVEESPSEDFFFLEKAAKYGFKTFVFTEVRGSHISGGLKVKSDGTVTTLDV